MKAFAVLLALLIAVPVMAAEQPVTKITIKGKKGHAVDNETKRQIEDLVHGSVVTMGEFTIPDAPIQTLTVTHRGISTNSIIYLMPANTTAKNKHTTGAYSLPFPHSPTKGQFTVHFYGPDATYNGARYRYVFFTPRRPLN